MSEEAAYVSDRKDETVSGGAQQVIIRKVEALERNARLRICFDAAVKTWPYASPEEIDEHRHYLLTDLPVRRTQTGVWLTGSCGGEAKHEGLRADQPLFATVHHR